jgi:tetraprenyl-beta-curcumene synthase
VRDEIRWAARNVLRSPARLRFLLGGGATALLHLRHFLQTIVPHAALELHGLRQVALSIPDERMRAQALASIDGKAYHAAGACILATFLPHPAARAYVELVTPLESIYDYLDNLCDRHPGVTPQAYPVLHQAVCDALDPAASPGDYYRLGPAGDDNGYLLRLVARVQRSLRRLGGYESLVSVFREAAALYAEMQTYKHFPAGEREPAMIAWYEARRDERTTDLRWYEFACAAGSQLQVYAPLFELLAGRSELVRSSYEAYFPSIAALHVLLDSFIDQAEDRAHRELNFAALYASDGDMRGRVGYLAQAARRCFSRLPDRACHAFVLRIMALFYLTHPKVYEQHFERRAELLLGAL